MNKLENFNDYFLMQEKLLTGNKLTITVGNEACDADSLISSLVLGVLLQCVFALKIPRDVFMQKRELLSLLSDFEIPVEKIVFLKDHNLIYEDKTYSLVGKQVDFILTDHNHHKGLMEGHRVVGIYDHHEDLNMHNGVSIRHIDTTAGSCCTLIGKNFLQEIRDSNLHNALFRLILYSIYIDTYEFTTSYGEVDKQISEYIMQRLGIKVEYLHEFYHNYCIMKNSLEGYTTRDLLRRDLKVFEYNNEVYAISALECTSDDFVHKVGESFSFDIELFKSEMKAQYIIITLLNPEDGSRLLYHSGIPAEIINRIPEKGIKIMKGAGKVQLTYYASDCRRKMLSNALFKR